MRLVGADVVGSSRPASVGRRTALVAERIVREIVTGLALARRSDG